MPQRDLRGKITSHRARSTIATQLFNAKEPMNLYELQEWLGHRLPSSTQRYAKITPTKLMKSYSDAGYFGRNLRMIEVLIDQEKVRAGVGVQEAWKFYDLGHGYCTYDFFDQCPHRMACAKCSFYMPKGSTASVLLEGKNNLLLMRQEIPLTDAEAAAVDDGAFALDSLLKRLADVPTPAGPTPLQLSAALRLRAKRRTDPLKQKSKKALQHRPRAFEVKGQTGACSLVSDDSAAASGPDAGACGSGSSRSSLRTRSARIDQEVIFAVLAFLPLPFAYS